MRREHVVDCVKGPQGRNAAIPGYEPGQEYSRKQKTNTNKHVKREIGCTWLRSHRREPTRPYRLPGVASTSSPIPNQDEAASITLPFFDCFKF